MLSIPWNSLVTSYPPGEIEMLEREAARRDGILFGSKAGKVIAAVVVGKWESRGVGGISKLDGKVVCTFPASVFSTTFFPSRG
jgi:hypothetical protein